MVDIISIVMPLYNKEDTVIESIDSVINQTIADWELIIIDDGSTDNGLGIVKSINDDRIRVISQKNSGVSAARNKGITESKSQLIAFLDADDQWKPDFLKRIIRLYNDYKEASYYATAYSLEGSDGKRKKVRLNGLPQGFKRGLMTNYFEIASKSDPPVFTSAVVVKKEAIMQIGGFPSGVRSGEDLLTWAKLAYHGDLAYDAEDCVIFKVSGIERPVDNKDKVGKELIKLAKNQNKPGIRDYIGLWYRMQTTMALRFEKRFQAFKLSLYSVFWSPLQVRSWYIFISVFIPTTMKDKLDALIRSKRASGKK